jgi:MFS family permease
MAVIPILWWTQHLSFAALLALTFAIGTFAAPYFSSSRLIIPEVVGEDERLVAQGNAILGGGNMITQIAGPVLAGVLIAATSPAAVLVVDGATYVFSFLTIAAVVRAGCRVAETPASKGVLAGLRFLFGDSLLGPLMAVAVVLNFVAQGLIIGVQGLAYFRYHESPHVAGFLFGGFGVGALLGSIAAQQLAQKADLLKLVAASIVAMPLPLWLLGIRIPWAAAMVVIGAFAFFTPLVNAPLIGIITTRTPPALRPKVMTAVLTLASAAGPLGFLVAGESLRWISLTTLFVLVAAGLTALGLAAAAVILRGRAAADLVAVPDVAHG